MVLELLLGSFMTARQCCTKARLKVQVQAPSLEVAPLWS